MKLVTLALVSLFATSAFAQSNYEKIKALYDNAKAPASAEAVIAKIPSIKGCAVVNQQSQTSAESLVVVRHTIVGAGPEIPDVNLRGIGFSGADDRALLFFDHYEQSLSSQGLAISYRYEYTYNKCWGSGVDRECESYDALRAADAVIRVSDKYILFAQSGIYGYCWF